MARKSERKNLGRGLSALLGDGVSDEVSVTPSKSGRTVAAPDRPIQTLPIDVIHPNPDQPRHDFREAELEELADSIRARGVIQPVILRRDPSDTNAYQIVAGERRWRAAQRAGLHDLPVVVRELSDQDVLELAIIENIQRADLNPVEEARGYSQLIEKFKYSQEVLAKIVGKSRPHLANTMRLLALPASVQQLVRDGKLSAGHARALITAIDPVALASQVVAKGLSVRQTEELARKTSNSAAATHAVRKPEKDADTRQIEGDLSAAIGLKVSIDHKSGGGGELKIRYGSLDDLDSLMQKLNG